MQAANHAASEHSSLLQHAQAQLLISNASLAEAQLQTLTLQSQIERLTQEVDSARMQAASFQQQISDAVERAHLSEAHAVQMQVASRVM